METATLRVTVSGKRIAFRASSAGGAVSSVGPPMAVAREFQGALDEHEYSAPDQRGQVIKEHADSLIPTSVGTWFRQWAGEADDAAVLCVHAADPLLAGMPWAELLAPAGGTPGPGQVARVCRLSGASPPPPAEALPVLLAGWVKLMGHPMPGVERELLQFKSEIDQRRLPVTAVHDPTGDQLLRACSVTVAAIVHLSPPSLVRRRGELAIPVARAAAGGGRPRRGKPAGGSRFDTVSLDRLCRSLARNSGVRMVHVNACHAGPVACRQIAETLGAVAVGWPALVSDDIAADFTFFFYQRLLEGLTPAAAVRSFARTVGDSRTPIELPVIWLPSPAWAGWQPLTGPAGARPAGRAGRKARPGRPPGPPAGDGPAAPAEPAVPPADGGPAAPTAPAAVQLAFEPRPYINPALLVNGLHPIKYIRIDSPVEQQVHLSITCDTGAGSSTYRQTVLLKKGGGPVLPEQIHFPALHELIERQAHRRRVSFTATVTDAGGRELAGQTETAVWMGATEWLDQRETWAYIPAFVNPYDDGVLRVFDLARKVLRTLGDPRDAFTGYRQDPPSAEYVTRQMRAIFQTLRDDTVGLTYISPPGSPVYDGTEKPAGQVVRAHREVIERRLGTCHDLALLLAACAEYVGIRPLIVLVPGHTAFGYWTGPAHQEAYWEARKGGLRSQEPGEGWTLTDGDDLWRLVSRKKVVVLVEATCLCEPETTFDQACKNGTKWFRQVRDEMDVAIDVYAARRAIQPV